jgi:hypothetical protein
VSDLDRLDFQRGDALKASQLQAIVDAVRKCLGKIVGGTGVDVRRDARGNTVITGRQRPVWIGKANGNIPAASGSAWGAGSVTRWSVDGSGNEYTTSVNYDVLNPSSTTMTSGNGIDSGQRCRVWQDEDGNLIVEPLECS